MIVTVSYINKCQKNIVMINNILQLFQALSTGMTVVEILFDNMAHELHNLLSSNRRSFEFNTLKESFIVQRTYV